MKYVLEREELRNSPIILYGQSLGGAVAIYLAEKHRNEVRLMRCTTDSRSMR